jgi:glycine cleavage system P protein (glycine dehydrogenase) subunit 1
MPYISLTETEIREMLERIGVRTIDDLFAPIPEEARFKGELRLPPPATELEIGRELTRAAAETTTLDRTNSFLGAGAYDHFIPSVIDHLAGRTEFYTAYTPYQPEASQGMLTAIFEYQSMIAALTGMEVSNASLYDGASGLAEAVMMAASIARRRRKVVVSGSVHPEHLATVRTYLENIDNELVVVPALDGVTDLECPRPASEIACDLWPLGIQPGVPLSKWYPERENQLLVAVTEKKTREEIDALAEALETVAAGGQA